MLRMIRGSEPQAGRTRLPRGVDAGNLNASAGASLPRVPVGMLSRRD